MLIALIASLQENQLAHITTKLEAKIDALICESRAKVFALTYTLKDVDETKVTHVEIFTKTDNGTLKKRELQYVKQQRI